MVICSRVVIYDATSRKARQSVLVSHVSWLFPHRTLIMQLPILSPCLRALSTFLKGCGNLYAPPQRFLGSPPTPPAGSRSRTCAWLQFKGLPPSWPLSYSNRLVPSFPERLAAAVHIHYRHPVAWPSRSVGHYKYHGHDVAQREDGPPLLDIRWEHVGLCGGQYAA